MEAEDKQRLDHHREHRRRARGQGVRHRKQEIGKYNGQLRRLLRPRVLKRIRMFANFTPIIRAIATASHLSLFLGSPAS
jgi:DNA invertase Pin-like site-specific DNA recombinase